MDHGERLARASEEVARLRAALAADPREAAAVGALKAWQAQRLARTHRDLLGDPRHAAAARFFLDDLYGAKDFSRRDAELARIVPMMVRLLPDAALATVADAVEMDALSERLDRVMARHLGERSGAPIDAPAYAAAYRRVGSRAERERQLALIATIGRSLDGLVRHPMLGRLLRLMAGPARVAGLSQMHDFLVRGFQAFRAMGGASTFLERIEHRERVILEALYAGASEGWDGPLPEAAPPRAGGPARPDGPTREASAPNRTVSNRN